MSGICFTMLQKIKVFTDEGKNKQPTSIQLNTDYISNIPKVKLVYSNLVASASFTFTNRRPHLVDRVTTNFSQGNPKPPKGDYPSPPTKTYLRTCSKVQPCDFIPVSTSDFLYSGRSLQLHSQLVIHKNSSLINFKPIQIIFQFQ